MLTAAHEQSRSRSRVAAAALAGAALWPVHRVEHGPVVCPFRLLTGLPCPLCGLTRSFVYTLHGRFGDAFAAHLFGPLVVVLVAAWLVQGARGAGSWSDPTRWFSGRARPLAVGLSAGWLTYAALRIVLA